MKSSALLPATVEPETANTTPAGAVAQKPENGATKLNRDFSVTVTAAGGANGNPGEEQAEAVREFLRQLLGQLGIPESRLDIRFNREAAGVAANYSANGVFKGGVVYLAPRMVTPETESGRRVMAHEAAHLAQSFAETPAAAPEDDFDVLEAAEAEANRVAAEYEATGTVAPVQVALPAAAVVGDTGVKETGETETTVTKRKPAPIASAGKTAKASREAEIERIIDLLSYGLFDWGITDNDVLQALEILAMYPILTACGISRAIGEKYRVRLLKNLNPPHFKHYRRQVLAVAWAAESAAEFDGLEEEILNPMDLVDLDLAEATAIADILDMAPEVERAARNDQARSKRIDEIKKAADSEEAVRTMEEAIKDAAKAEEAPQGPSEDDKEAVAKLVNNIRLKLDEFHVSDAEALELLDRMVALLETLDPAPLFRAVALGIGPKLVSELMDQIPVKGLYDTEKRRVAFTHLAATRPAFVNQQQAADLILSSPNSEDAFLAFLLVKAMPEMPRTAFLKAIRIDWKGSEVKRWDELIAALPVNIRESETFNFYTGAKEKQDEQAILGQLLDEKLWTAEGAPRLDAVIRMARAAGHAEFVFNQSKTRRAEQIKGLEEVVKKYQLYAEGVRDTYIETKLETKPWYQEGFLGSLANVGRWLSFIGSCLGKIRLAEFSGISIDADLAQYQGIEGGSVSGARLRETTEEERDAAYKRGGIPVNVARATLRKFETILEAEEIAIDHLAYTGSIAVTAQPVILKKLYVAVTHDDILLPWSKRKVQRLHVSFESVTVRDCAIVRPESIYSINSLVVDKPAVDAENVGSDKLEESGLMAMFTALFDSKEPVSISVGIGKLRADGIATSGGSWLDWFEVEGFHLHTGGNTKGYELALQGSLTRLKRRIEAELTAELTAGTPEEAKEHLTARENLEKQFMKVEAELKRGARQGSVVDIQSLKVSGVEGLTEDELALADIHGQGESPTAIMPLFADPSSMRTMVTGSRRGATLKGKLPGEEEFSIDISKIRNKEPLRLTGAIPTAEQAQKEFDDFIRDNKASRTKEGYQAAIDALKLRADIARQYEELAKKGVQFLKEPDEVRDYQGFRNWLIWFEENRATVIEKVLLEGVSLNISGQGNPEVMATTLSVEGITTKRPDGSENLKIREITGQDAGVSAVFQGGLANAKEWRKNLDQAGIKARNLTVKDIRHAGTGATIEELTFTGEGEEAGLDATLTRKGEGREATVDIKARRVTARNISIPAYEGLLNAELTRLYGIEETDRSLEEKQRIESIEAMLGDLKNIDGRKQAAEAELASKKGKTARDAANKKLAAVNQDFKDWEERLIVANLSIDQLNISIGGLGDVFAEGYNFSDANYEIQGKGPDGHWLERAEAGGIRTRTAAGDQVVADKIVAGPVSGTVKKIENGYELKDFKIQSLALTGVSYRSGDIFVQSTGESQLADIVISATMTSTESGTNLTLTSVTIGKLVASGIRYEDAEKSVTVPSGELIGISLTGMEVYLPSKSAEKAGAKKAYSGTVEIAGMKKLAVGALTGGYGIGATLNAAPKDAKAIKVNLAKSGEITVDLQGIHGWARVDELGTKNKVIVQFKNLRGQVVKNGDNISIRALQLGELSLSQMHWDASGKIIDINDRVTVSGIEVDAEVEMGPKPAKPGAKAKKKTEDGKEEEPEKELKSVKISKLKAADILAKSVVVTLPAVAEDKAKGIEASKQKRFELEEANIRGLLVTGTNILRTGGTLALQDGKFEVTKSLSITNLQATVGDITKEEIKRATISTKMYGKEAEEPGKGGRELSATLTAKDGTILRIGRTDQVTLADIAAGKFDTSGTKPKLESGVAVDKVVLNGITTGDIIIKDDEISVSDIEIAGPVDVTAVTWLGDGKAVKADAISFTEVVKVGKVDAKFDVTTTTGPDGTPKTKSEIKTLVIDNISAPKITGTNVTYSGPLKSKTGSRHVDVVLPKATINGFEIEQVSKDFATTILKLNPKFQSASVESFALTLTDTVAGMVKTKKLGANISAGAFRATTVFKTTGAGTAAEATELSDGVFELDSLGLREITATLSGDGKDRTVDLKSKFLGNLGGTEAGADATNLSYKTSDGVARVGSMALHGVRYIDPNLGLTLDIQEALVPQTVSIPEKGPITIPEGKITNAYFKIDDLMALRSGKKDDTDSGIDTTQFYNMLDHVNGHLNADVFVSFSALGQEVFPLRIPITDGKFNFDEVRKNALWLRNRAVSDLEMERQGDDIFYVDFLALEVLGFNVLTWTPDSDAELEEMKNNTVRIKRIVRPEVHHLVQFASDVSGDPGDPSMADEVELRDVDAKLSLTGQVPLDLGELGKLRLGLPGKDAMTDLIVNSKGSHHMTWSLGTLGVAIDSLNIKGNKVKGEKAGGALIEINGIKEGTLDFTNGKVMKPGKIEGTISEAKVSNLSVELAEDEK